MVNSRCKQTTTCFGCCCRAKRGKIRFFFRIPKADRLNPKKKGKITNNLGEMPEMGYEEAYP